MNKITVEFDNEKVSFGINHIKYLMGDNYLKKFRFLSSVRQSMQKVSNSEFAEECNVKNGMQYNDSSVDYKKWLYCEVNANYDILTDLKLGSKSLISKYFESQVQDIDYNDTIHTINILFEQLADELLLDNLLIDNDDLKFNLEFDELGSKNIIKNVSINLKRNELGINQYDLSYYDIVEFQFSMIKKIAERNIDKNVLVIFDCPFVNEKMYKKLDDIKHGNLFSIIGSSSYFDVNVDDVIYFGKKIIDISDDNLLYEEVLCELPFVVEVKELKSIFCELLNGKENDRISYIKANF